MSAKVISEVMGMPGLVATVGSSASLSAALVLMRAKNIPYQVVKDDEDDERIVGILALDDLLERGLPHGHDQAEGESREDLTVADVMTPLPGGLEDGANVDEALAKMDEYRTSALPIVHRGALVAVVTKAQLLRVSEAKAESEVLEQAGRRGMVSLANPIVQRAMFLLGEAGI